MRIEKRLYCSVDDYSNQELDYIIPNGKTLWLEYFGGSSVLSNNAKVEIISCSSSVDELLFVTHACVPHQPTHLTFQGDGTLSIKIKLTNDTSQAETMGGYWIGVLE